MFGRLKKTNRIAALLVAFSMVAPSVNAASVTPRGAGATALSAAMIAIPSGAEITQVQDRRRDVRRSGNRDYRWDRKRKYRRDDRGVHRRDDWRDDRRVERRFDRRVDRDQRRRNGYRGYPYRRDGYRRDNDGWWYPLAAFGIGVILLNEANKNRQSRSIVTAPAPQSGFSHIPAGNAAAHDAWCNQKYRSYDWGSKTFQPYTGARRYCNSPYDLL